MRFKIGIMTLVGHAYQVTREFYVEARDDAEALYEARFRTMAGDRAICVSPQTDVGDIHDLLFDAPGG